MQWVVFAIPVAIIVFYFKLDSFLNRFEINDADSRNEKIIQIKDRRALVQILQENIGNIVTIQSTVFTRVYENRLIEDNRKITGRILEVDENWINIE